MFQRFFRSAAFIMTSSHRDARGRRLVAASLGWDRFPGSPLSVRRQEV